MKKLIISNVILLSSICCFGQFSTFEPYIAPNSNYMTPSNSYSDVGEVIKTTGYILTENGSVKSKIQIKVAIETTEFGESLRIVAIYNVISGFGANWERVSVKAQAIGGQLPIGRQQEVAYANFTYWAYWNGDKIWFN